MLNFIGKHYNLSDKKYINTLDIGDILQCWFLMHDLPIELCSFFKIILKFFGTTCSSQPLNVMLG